MRWNSRTVETKKSQVASNNSYRIKKTHVIKQEKKLSMQPENRKKRELTYPRNGGGEKRRRGGVLRRSLVLESLWEAWTRSEGLVLSTFDGSSSPSGTSIISDSATGKASISRLSLSFLIRRFILNSFYTFKCGKAILATLSVTNEQHLHFNPLNKVFCSFQSIHRMKGHYLRFSMIFQIYMTCR